MGDVKEKQTRVSPPLPSARKLATPRKKRPVVGKVGVDVFALWHKAGQINVPVSSWHPKRNLFREAHQGGFIDGSTLRSAIVGPKSLPIPDEDDERCYEEPTAFEGTWISRADGDLRGSIEGSWLIWADDGSRTRLRIIKAHSRGGSGDVVAMLLDGKAHSGVLSEDGHILRWGDGDRWLRIDAHYERMEGYCENAKSHLDGSQLQGWSVHENCILSRPVSRSRPSTSSPRPSTTRSSTTTSRYLSARPVSSSVQFRPATH